MDLWRPWIQARAGDLLEEMRSAETNQQEFADLSKRLITVLQSEMGDASENNEDGEDADDDGNQDNNDDGQSDEAQSATGEDDTSDDDGQSLKQDGDEAGHGI